MAQTQKKRLNLNTFGDPTFKGRICDLVQMCLQKTGSSDCLVVEALSFPTICFSLPNAVNLEQYPCLCRLDLADPPGKAPEGIDLLIGSDHYWNIVQEGVVHTEGGPIAVKSGFSLDL